MTLRCYCCGGSYERGHFRCCAPPNNMASHVWMTQWCRVEISPGKFCNKCPRCGCGHRTAPTITGGEIGFSTVADILPERTRGNLKKIALAPTRRDSVRKEWTPYREVGEEIES